MLRKGQGYLCVEGRPHEGQEADATYSLRRETIRIPRNVPWPWPSTLQNCGKKSLSIV